MLAVRNCKIMPTTADKLVKQVVLAIVHYPTGYHPVAVARYIQCLNKNSAEKRGWALGFHFLSSTYSTMNGKPTSTVQFQDSDIDL